MFLNDVDIMLQENEQRKKQEERAAARKKAEEAKALEAANAPEGKQVAKGVVGKGRKGRGRSVLEADEPCLVDRLMQEIRGGTFKLRRTVPAGQA